MEPEKFRFTEAEKVTIKRALGYAAGRQFFSKSDELLITSVLRKLGALMGRDDPDFYSAYTNPNLR